MHSDDDAHDSPGERSGTHVPPSQRPEAHARDEVHGSPRSDARTHVPDSQNER